MNGKAVLRPPDVTRVHKVHNSLLGFIISGDVETLMKEHRENQDLVRSIGASQYQIVFPVQLRHREKMGISTREIGATKVLPPPRHR